MIIAGIDIAYKLGYLVADYDTKLKKITILNSGIIDVRNKKSHKEWHLGEQFGKLVSTINADLIICESQFFRKMYIIDGIIACQIPPTIKFERIFSKRARVLAFGEGQGGLAKEEAAAKVIELYPELKDAKEDVLDSMVLVLAFINAFESNQPLEAPKKPKKVKAPKIPKVPKKLKPLKEAPKAKIQKKKKKSEG
jgi:hypothetical protein